MSALNSVGRLFTVMRLIAGLLSVSALVSSLSSHMTNASAEKADKVSSLFRVRRFLRWRFLQQAQVSGTLRVSITGQVSTKRMAELRLSHADVPAREKEFSAPEQQVKIAGGGGLLGTLRSLTRF